MGGTETNKEPSEQSERLSLLPYPSRYPFPTVVGRSPVPAGRHDGRGRVETKIAINSKLCSSFTRVTH